MLDRAQLWDAFLAADPELARLRQATRATLTAIVALALLHAIATAIGQPTSAALLGINMAMLGTVIVQDTELRAQQITLACVPVVAAASLLTATLAAPLPWLRTAIFLSICFVAVLVRRFGPRGLALGTVGFLAYFFALFFQASLAQLPLMIGGIVVATGLAYIVRFHLLRDAPATLLALRLAGLRRNAAVLLHDLAQATADGQVSDDRQAAARRTLGRIHTASVALDEQLTGYAPTLRVQVFARQLAIESLATSIPAWIATAPPADRAPLAAALSAARSLLRRRGPIAEQRAKQALEAARAQLTGGDGPVVTDALAALLLAMATRVAIPGEPSTTKAPPLPPAPVQPTLRPALQATVAAALALIAGSLVASTHAYWAVLASFMVFTRATSVGAALARAWQRTLGTILGVLVGVAIAGVIQGHERLELALVFACMFVAYYTLQVAYTWTVAAFTTLLAVLYSLLGRYTPELLYLRVLETMVGAGIGALVATVVFPVPTRTALRDGLTTGMQLLATLLERALVDRVARDDLHADARALDRKLGDLRAEVQRATAGLPLPPTRAVARAFVAFATVCLHARALVGAAAPESASLREAGVQLVAGVRTLIDPPQHAFPSIAPQLAAARTALGPEPPRALVLAIRRLERVDASLVELARVLQDTGITTT